MCKRPPRMCCVVFVFVLLRCCFCCKAITFIYVFAYLAVRQAVDGSGGGSGACRGCHAAIASFDTEHFLFNFHASHAYPDGALPPPVSLFHSLFFLIYFRIYLYIFACLVTFYLPLSHSHFVQVISGTLLIQFWTLSLPVIRVTRPTKRRKGGGGSHLSTSCLRIFREKQ